eukprot:TRINITY_DN4380_c0_g1_i3.p1 TRINITY_DN4380_c0_g1~~TRINITY_DN4380_c0_g1_i3.p1  ORF type:complete len:497 (+),score=101.80 TRINITY_DN4380_c0_g1_i3:255-1745(+)
MSQLHTGSVPASPYSAHHTPMGQTRKAMASQEEPSPPSIERAAQGLVGLFEHKVTGEHSGLTVAVDYNSTSYRQPAPEYSPALSSQGGNIGSGPPSARLPPPSSAKSEPPLTPSLTSIGRRLNLNSDNSIVSPSSQKAMDVTKSERISPPIRQEKKRARHTGSKGKGARRELSTNSTGSASSRRTGSTVAGTAGPFYVLSGPDDGITQTNPALLLLQKEEACHVPNVAPPKQDLKLYESTPYRLTVKGLPTNLHVSAFDLSIVFWKGNTKTQSTRFCLHHPGKKKSDKSRPEFSKKSDELTVRFSIGEFVGKQVVVHEDEKSRGARDSYCLLLSAPNLGPGLCTSAFHLYGRNSKTHHTKGRNSKNRATGDANKSSPDSGESAVSTGSASNAARRNGARNTPKKGPASPRKRASTARQQSMEKKVVGGKSARGKGKGKNAASRRRNGEADEQNQQRQMHATPVVSSADSPDVGALPPTTNDALALLLQCADANTSQ